MRLRNRALVVQDSMHRALRMLAFFELLGGVPAIDRLRGLRQRSAVVGPGLPLADIGIELPPGQGALLFEPSGYPREFHKVR